MAEEITVVSSDLERQAKQMRRHILKMIYHAGSGHPVEAIFASLDKKLMKKRWIEDNISSPKGILVESLNHARNAISDLGLPAVIKPSNSSGSRGVLIIESKTPSKQLSLKPCSTSSMNRVLVEQFIAGHTTM